jgi:diguanylate cyclase (GGDEF)-like protein
MNHRQHELMGLLADLHAATPYPYEKRAAALERLIASLGDVLAANQVHLLGPGQNVPHFVGGSGSKVSLRGPGCKISTWWDSWLACLRTLPPDGRVRRGLVLPGRGGVRVSPGGWGENQAAGDRPEEQTALPVMTLGLGLDRRPLRLAFLRATGSLRFTHEEEAVLAGVADHLAIHGRISGRLERLRRETVTDELTRIYNYRYLKRTLVKLLRRIPRHGGVLSVLMLDVDNLRAYNGQFGHLEASAALAAVGRVLRDSLDSNGWVAKYGGDEFLIVLPGSIKEEALAQAHHLRGSVERARVGHATFGGITCSIGVATAPRDGTSYQALLGSADRALFAAKAEGRNTVVVAPAPDVGPSRDRSGERARLEPPRPPHSADLPDPEDQSRAA